MTYSGPSVWIETHDVYLRPRFIRELLRAFIDPTAGSEAYMMPADTLRMVEEGILEKREDGTYLLTETGKDAIDAEQGLWERWSGVIR